MIWQTRSTGSADTERLGDLIGRRLKGGEVIELVSDLGGGKTTLVRGLARGAGSSTAVASPTFTLQKIYKAQDLEIHHFDFYRLDKAGVIAGMLEESLGDPKVVTVIEWSQLISGVLPPARLIIELEPVATSSDGRLISIKYRPSEQKLVEQLKNDWEVLKP